jgi:hypothetical protein
MEKLFNKEEHAKNIYVIKHNLNDLKMKPGTFYYELEIGPFILQIFADKVHGFPKYLAQCEMVDVRLYELERKEEGKAQGFHSLVLNHDPRFKNYKPIMYNFWTNPNDGHIINMSSGDNMPILYLCELIRYLHRLANLTAFM